MKTKQSVTLPEVLGGPASKQLAESRRAVSDWFANTAVLINWDMIDTPIGPLYLAVTDNGLNHVGFSQPQDSFIGQLNPMARTERNPRAITEVADQLVEYFAGRRKMFDLRVDWRGVGDFQRRVLLASLDIPLGRTLTYQQVAQAIGKPKSSRAVGQALARNPIPVVIPCHRVLGSDGSLHGYAGGLDRKEILLRLEGAI
jgi:methylated-DNA-[protein]-cysteine S-methyltransferase